jgi:hypothetical protein
MKAGKTDLSKKKYRCLLTRSNDHCTRLVLEVKSEGGETVKAKIDNTRR